mmetsp:Transcript_7570/g.18544  ORF Transcript_7570/g.18544 Transcript_7570/m.18544 type:complete len:413 (-) Transcript_7570:85-1323(-)
MYSRDDRVTEVTHQSFLGKMGGACCGLLVGLMLYAGAGALIWWNEGRAVFTDRAIHAGLASVVESPSCDVLDATLEGRLVHVSCPLGRLDNYSFIGGALRVETAAFVRVDAEMYQWEEMTRSETTKDSVGGGSTTRKTYSYSTGWLGSSVDSAHFKKSSNHRNPPASAWPLTSHTQYSADAQLGAYRLGALVQKLQNAEPVPIPLNWPTASDGAQLSGPQPPSTLSRENTISAEGKLYTAWPQQSNFPIGSMRVQFSRATATEASVLAAQSRGGFVGWGANDKVRKGYEVMQLFEGSLTASEMFEKMADDNASLTWTLAGARRGPPRRRGAERVRLRGRVPLGQGQVGRQHARTAHAQHYIRELVGPFRPPSRAAAQLLPSRRTAVRRLRRAAWPARLQCGVCSLTGHHLNQ